MILLKQTSFRLENLETRRLLTSVPLGFESVLTADLDGDGRSDDRLIHNSTSNETRFLLEGSEADLRGWDMALGRWRVQAERHEAGSVRESVVFRDAGGGSDVLKWDFSGGGLRISVGDPGAPVSDGAGGDHDAPEEEEPSEPEPTGGDGGDGGRPTQGTGGDYTSGFIGDFNGDGLRDDRLVLRDGGRLVFELGREVEVQAWTLDVSSWSVDIGRLEAEPTRDSAVLKSSAGDVVVWQVRGERLVTAFGEPGPFVDGDGGRGQDREDDGDGRGGQEDEPGGDDSGGSTSEPGADSGSDGSLILTGDFNGDGAEDRFVRLDTGQMAFQLSGSGGDIGAWTMDLTLWAFRLVDLQGEAGRQAVLVQNQSDAGYKLTWSIEGESFLSRGGDDGTTLPVSNDPGPGTPEPQPEPEPQPDPDPEADPPSDPVSPDEPGTDPTPAGDPIDSVFYIGHSLIDVRVPLYASGIAGASGLGYDQVDLQLNWNSPLSFNWDYYEDRSQPSAGIDARTALAGQAYDAVVMAPGVPLLSVIENENPAEFASRFADLALQTNPDTRILLYHHWPEISTAPDGTPGYARGTTLPYADTWLQQVQLEYDHMLELVEQTNALIRTRHPDAAGVELIPAGLVLRELQLRLNDGTFDGRGVFDDVTDLYSDALHLTDLGMSLAAATVHASLYGHDPSTVDGIGTLYRDEQRDYVGPVFSIDDGLASDLYALAYQVVQDQRGE